MAVRAGPDAGAERVFRLFEELEPGSDGVEPSGPDGGACFWFTLPRASAGAAGG